MDRVASGEASDVNMSKPAFTSCSSLLLVAAALSACSGQALDVGSSSGGAGASSVDSTTAGTTTFVSAGTGGSADFGNGAGGAVDPSTSLPTAGGDASVEDPEPQPPWPDNGACSTTPSAIDGTWTGYVQGQGHEYDFTLVLTGGGDTPCGTFTVGEPKEYLPATDPESNYLESQFTPKQLELAPGYAYTLLDVDASLPRLQFRVSYAEPYASWCGLQTSYHDDFNGGYACLPNNDRGALVDGDRCVATYPDGEREYACDQWELCLGTIDRPCSCQESGCLANLEGSGPYFDLHFDGDQASGLGIIGDVFLQKQ